MSYATIEKVAIVAEMPWLCLANSLLWNASQRDPPKPLGKERSMPDLPALHTPSHQSRHRKLWTGAVVNFFPVICSSDPQHGPGRPHYAYSVPPFYPKVLVRAPASKGLLRVATSSIVSTADASLWNHCLPSTANLPYNKPRRKAYIVHPSSEHRVSYMPIFSKKNHHAPVTLGLSLQDHQSNATDLLASAHW